MIAGRLSFPLILMGCVCAGLVVWDYMPCGLVPVPRGMCFCRTRTGGGFVHPPPSSININGQKMGLSHAWHEAGRLWASISRDGQFDLHPLYVYKLRQKHHLDALHPLRSMRYHGLQVRRQALHVTLGDTNPVPGAKSPSSTRQARVIGGVRGGEPSEHQANSSTASHPAPAISGLCPRAGRGLGRR